MSRDLTPATALAIGEALAAADRMRRARPPSAAPFGAVSLPPEQRALATKLRELDATLCALLREKDRLDVDLGLIAVGVSLRALAARLEGAP